MGENEFPIIEKDHKWKYTERGKHAANLKERFGSSWPK